MVLLLRICNDGGEEGGESTEVDTSGWSANKCGGGVVLRVRL